MKEHSLEVRFCHLVNAAGCLQFKVGFDGWPDRQVLVTKDRHYWAELKSPTGKLRPNQIQRILLLRQHGDLVLVLDGTEPLGEVLDAALNYVWGSTSTMHSVLRGPATRLE